MRKCKSFIFHNNSIQRLETFFERIFEEDVNGVGNTENNFLLGHVLEKQFDKSFDALILEHIITLVDDRKKLLRLANHSHAVVSARGECDKHL